MLLTSTKAFNLEVIKRNWNRVISEKIYKMSTVRWVIWRFFRRSLKKIKLMCKHHRSDIFSTEWKQRTTVIQSNNHLMQHFHFAGRLGSLRFYTWLEWVNRCAVSFNKKTHTGVGRERDWTTVFLIAQDHSNEKMAIVKNH